MFVMKLVIFYTIMKNAKMIQAKTVKYLMLMGLRI